MNSDITSHDNVIVVSFHDDSEAYEGMTVLKELDSQGQIDLQAAAVVSRGEDGQTSIKDETTDHPFVGTATGGILGLLIGVLGGPVGVLIGGAVGVLIGALFDDDDERDSESVLTDVSRSLRIGRTSLLAEVKEPSSEVIDSAMNRLGGEVVRHAVSEIEVEIAAAEDAARTARREARKQLREAKQQKRKEEIDAKIAELKAKLHHAKVPAPTDA